MGDQHKLFPVPVVSIFFTEELLIVFLRKVIFSSLYVLLGVSLGSLWVFKKFFGVCRGFNRQVLKVLCLVGVAHQQYSSNVCRVNFLLGKDFGWPYQASGHSKRGIFARNLVFCAELRPRRMDILLGKILWGLLSIISWWIVGTVDLIGAGFVWLIS